MWIETQYVFAKSDCPEDFCRPSSASHVEEAISAWHSRENLRNIVKPFWTRGAGAPGNDALREKEATGRWNDRKVSRWLGNAEKTQPTRWVKPKDEPGSSLKTHRWCEEWWTSNAGNALHTTINQCHNTRGVEAQVKKYLLLKPPSRSGYYKNNYENFNNELAHQGNNWYKPRNDMDKRRSCTNCSSTDHHVSACPIYKQGMKAIGFSLEDENASEVDHEDFLRGVIAKFGPRCFFCNLEGQI